MDITLERIPAALAMSSCLSASDEVDAALRTSLMAVAAFGRSPADRWSMPSRVAVSTAAPPQHLEFR